MPTNLNTQRIIDTLREPPCNWNIWKSSSIAWAGKSPERTYASIGITSKHASMQCVFSPDLPEHIAIRNMNYLLAFVAAAGAPDAIGWITGRVKQALAADTYRRSIVINMLHIMLTIDKQRSLTTVTIRPCNARVYDH